MLAAPVRIACLLALLSSVVAPARASAQAREPSQSQPAVAYFCPMHPEVIAPTPGRCSKCGMALIAGDPFEEREYRLAIETEPAAPHAGRPLTIRLRVFDPTTDAPITGFQVVHDKIYHLFVVSQDLTHFFHVHPEQQPDGGFTIELTLPEPGHYKVYSDFLPLGGTPQVIGRTIVTAGYARDLVSSLARLSPDTSLTRTEDGMIVTLGLQPEQPVGGREATLKYRLTDQATDRPVIDLEPYLAAWGHTLILSEDSLEYVHAHPVEYLPEGGANRRGGPEVTFKAFFPRAGHYRLWTQFKRAGRVSTVSFTVRVAAPEIGDAR